MGSGNHTIIYEKSGIKHKLCRVFFGPDGSYYVTSPYHPTEKAILLKMTVNYALSEMQIPFEQAIDIASAEDDEKRLKLSHHPDGFVQFSGEGILSGKDSDGKIRGIGIMSWPLDAPVLGPAFGISIIGVQDFKLSAQPKGETCIFHEEEITPMPDADVITLEGYYFPALWRRFIKVEPDGTRTISIMHPARAVLRLKVIFPMERCSRQGFIGIELYTVCSNPRDVSPAFMLSGPTDNLRNNEEGQLLGDGIYCMYPRFGITPRRSVDYVMPTISQ